MLKEFNLVEDIRKYSIGANSYQTYNQILADGRVRNQKLPAIKSDPEALILPRSLLLESLNNYIDKLNNRTITNNEEKRCIKVLYDTCVDNIRIDQSSRLDLLVYSDGKADNVTELTADVLIGADGMNSGKKH